MASRRPVGGATRRVRHDGRLLGTVVAAGSLVSERSIAHRIRVILLFGGLAAVVASMAAGWWLAGKAVRPVRRAFEAQASFAADASHELRSPLAFIRAGVERLGEKGVGAARRAELGKEVVDDVDQLSALTERLLMLARADRGRLELSAQPVDIAAVCRASVRRLASARGLEAGPGHCAKPDGGAGRRDLAGAHRWRGPDGTSVLAPSAGLTPGAPLALRSEPARGRGPGVHSRRR